MYLCGEAQKSRAEPFNALALGPFSVASVAAELTSSPLVFIFLSSGKGGTHTSEGFIPILSSVNAQRLTADNVQQLLELLLIAICYRLLFSTFTLACLLFIFVCFTVS